MERLRIYTVCPVCCRRYGELLVTVVEVKLPVIEAIGTLQGVSHRRMSTVCGKNQRRFYCSGLSGGMIQK